MRRSIAQAQGQQPPAKNLFHVKYVSDDSVYLDAGRNAGLEEGMVLHLVHADPSGGTTESVRFQGQAPIADVRIFSVADSSARPKSSNRRGIWPSATLLIWMCKAFMRAKKKVNAAESENYPVVVTFSYGDPLDEEIRADHRLRKNRTADRKSDSRPNRIGCRHTCPSRAASVRGKSGS